MNKYTKNYGKSLLQILIAKSLKESAEKHIINMNKYTKNYGRTLAQQYKKEHLAETAVNKAIESLPDADSCEECGYKDNYHTQNCIRYE